MRDDFCVFILSHGRPDRVHTLRFLRGAGYTGRVVILVDDHDETVGEYVRVYGDIVHVFDKLAASAYTDPADNAYGLRGVVYARNAVYRVAKTLGVERFLVLDDDYTSFFYRLDSAGRYGSYRILTTFDEMIKSFVEYLDATGAGSIAMSQGGDHLGGEEGFRSHSRKVMNAFFCDVRRPVEFFGRINEDVNAYVLHGMRGTLFLTVMQAQLNQMQTQQNANGLTELYLDTGTYVKSFYSVLFAPSCVKIGVLGDYRSPHFRIHHAIDWRRTAPVILREEHRRT